MRDTSNLSPDMVELLGKEEGEVSYFGLGLGGGQVLLPLQEVIRTAGGHQLGVGGEEIGGQVLADGLREVGVGEVKEAILTAALGAVGQFQEFEARGRLVGQFLGRGGNHTPATANHGPGIEYCRQVGNNLFDA